MSSNYDALCLSHDPALDATGDRHALAAVALAEARRQHPNCELVLCRWSGGLVELGCPPHSTHPHETAWVDVEWLRIATAAAALQDDLEGLPQLYRAVHAYALRPCWEPDRLIKLRHLLLDDVTTCPGGC